MEKQSVVKITQKVDFEKRKKRKDRGQGHGFDSRYCRIWRKECASDELHGVKTSKKVDVVWRGLLITWVNVSGSVHYCK